MTGAVLYSFRRCPYAMRARMALDVAELQYEHREVALRDKPQAMLTLSPKGTVPVFLTEDGVVIDESLEIMLHALSQNDPEGWLRHETQDVVAVEAFLTEFKPALDRYKYASRYREDAQRGDIDPAQRQIAMDTLLHFAKYLGADAKQRALEYPRLIDVATFPFVRQFAAVEPEWWQATAPKPLQDWLTALVQSDRFKRIMKKHRLWVPG